MYYKLKLMSDEFVPIFYIVFYVALSICTLISIFFIAEFVLDVFKIAFKKLFRS